MPRVPTRLKSLAAMLLAATLGSVAVATAQDSRAAAVLDLTLNTMPKGELRVLLEGAEVWADIDALRTAGLERLDGDHQTVGSRTFVRLSSLSPTPEVRVDEAALSVTIVADPSLFSRSVLRFDAGRPAGIIYRSARSAFLNYGASWAGGNARALSLETGVSVGSALASSTVFLRGDGRPSRGLTSVTFDDRARLNRIVVGDTVIATGPLGGSLQVAGVSIARDFSLDPYFIRYPTTGLSGVVTTPSRVEVYVNRQLVRSFQVQPGVYELADVALPAGAADTQVIVRDAFGGAQEYGGSSYVTTSVLAPGLHQFQYVVGAERFRPFDSLWSYGGPVVAGTHRFGATRHVTIGGRVELESGLASAGPTVSARLGRFGSVELTGAASRSGGRTGTASGLAYEYSGRTGSVQFAMRHASDAYATLSSRRMAMALRRDMLASGTLRVLPRLTISSQWHAQQAQTPLPASRRASLSSTLTVTERVAVFMTASQTRVGQEWSPAYFAGLSLGVRPRASAGMSAQHSEGRSRLVADLQQSAPVGTGVGYRVQASGLGGEPTLTDGDLRLHTRWGQVDVRHSHIDGAGGTSIQMNGALVAIGGRVLATRPIQDGFALVRVPQVAGVRAYVSQQEMGRTDRHGDLLLPNLISYYGNQIGIADADVPADRTLATNRLVLAPRFRGGAIAEFSAVREWRISGTLVVVGDALALRGTRAINAELVLDGPVRVQTWLGLDGDFYVEGAPPGEYRARVSAGTLTCEAVVTVPAMDAPVIKLGAVPCQHVEAPDR